MLRYNTQQKKLVLPEYGRNIQKMVDYCLTIDDKEERTVCAYQIIRSMSNLFPQLQEDEEGQKKLWDHLAIMSNFQLDIDYPVETIKKESLNTLPEKVPYEMQSIRYKHYGKNVEQMIQKASLMEESDERSELIRLLANHMKKIMLNVNPEGVDDEKIFKDIMEMSHGSIRINPDEMQLHEFKAAPQSNKKKKKK